MRTWLSCIIPLGATTFYHSVPTLFHTSRFCRWTSERNITSFPDRMISLCKSWALLSLSIVELMVYLPVEISTAVLSIYLCNMVMYNMVSYHVVGVVFLTQSPSLTRSNERNGSFRIELVIWYGTFLALAVVKSYLNLLACSGIWAPVNCPIYFFCLKIIWFIFTQSPCQRDNDTCSCRSI